MQNLSKSVCIYHLTYYVTLVFSELAKTNFVHLYRKSMYFLRLFCMDTILLKWRSHSRNTKCPWNHMTIVYICHLCRTIKMCYYEDPDNSWIVFAKIYMSFNQILKNRIFIKKRKKKILIPCRKTNNKTNKHENWFKKSKKKKKKKNNKASTYSHHMPCVWVVVRYEKKFKNLRSWLLTWVQIVA